MEREVIYNNGIYTLSGTEKRVGDVADDFLTVGANLEQVRFYDLPKGVKIISSCTSINTPLCAMQNKRLNAEVYISTRRLTALSISVDLPFSQSRFSFEEDLEYLTFLSDYQTLDFGRKYAVLIEELRLLSRALFVVDEENRIRYAEYITSHENKFNYIKAINIVKNLQK